MKVKNFDSNTMILGGWVAPPSKHYGTGVDYITDEVFRQVRESGVNVLYTNIDRTKHLPDLIRTIECAERNGVYLMIGDDSFLYGDIDEKEAVEFIEYCKRSKSVIGIDFGDEPNASKFSKLSEICKKHKPLMGDLLFYVNLLPMYAFAPHLKGLDSDDPFLRYPTMQEYGEYINDFLDNVDTDVLSFDYYPFTHEKGVIKSSYFKNLSVCARIAKERGIPLWNFIQLTSWQYETIRNMTYSEILWLVTTSLCYGVKGIQYFCYWTPTDFNGEFFNSAMINRLGQPTKSYYYVSEINKHIQKISPYILSYTYKGLIAYGETIAEVPEEDNLHIFGDLILLDSDGSLVGCFEKGGKFAYYLTNTSLTETKHLTVMLKKSGRFKIIKGVNEYTLEGQVLSFVLYEGEGVMIVEE